MATHLTGDTSKTALSDLPLHDGNHFVWKPTFKSL
jgi:hypothetical protein